MIILDTNVISELMKVSPDNKVIKWIDNQEITELFITTITIAEIEYGLNILPAGNRKSTLEDAFNKSIKQAFKYRVYPFDENSAKFYGEIMGKRKTLGKPMSVLDGQIASVVRAQGAILATRNICDFSHCDIELINPFGI
jgi:predicted nucleic acid-binding protein